jgi:hypothetical protein
MILVEECRLRLDDSVDPWLPELADRKVLRTIASPLDDTVPARTPDHAARDGGGLRNSDLIVELLPDGPRLRPTWSTHDLEALFNTQAVKLLMCSARESAGQQSQDCGLLDHGLSEVRLRHRHQVHIPELLRLVEEPVLYLDPVRCHALRNPASSCHGGLSLAVSDILKFFKNSAMPGDDDRSAARLFLLVTTKLGHARHRKGS